MKRYVYARGGNSCREGRSLQTRGLGIKALLKPSIMCMVCGDQQEIRADFDFYDSSTLPEGWMVTEKTNSPGEIAVCLCGECAPGFLTNGLTIEPWELRAAKRIVEEHWRVPDFVLQQRWVARVIQQERAKDE